jgi:hypothetical protein
MKSNS